MGINFSRALTLKYSYPVKSYLGADRAVISVGRVMTCVLGMVVNREREIREFVKIPFYRVLAGIDIAGRKCDCEWKAVEGSRYFASPLLYKDNGFLEKKTAEEFVHLLEEPPEPVARIHTIEKIIRKKADDLSAYRCEGFVLRGGKGDHQKHKWTKAVQYRSGSGERSGGVRKL